MKLGERQRALLELGAAFVVLIACIVTGLWLASLPPLDHSYGPDDPLPATTTTPSLPPLTRDPYVAEGSTPAPSPRTVPTGAAMRPTTVPRDAAGLSPRSRPSRGTAMHSPAPGGSAPHASPTPTSTPSSVSTVPPCLVSVLGVCVRLG